MSLTFIDTNKIAPVSIPGSGTLAEIMGEKLCGAKNVVGCLRWLAAGDKLALAVKPGFHELVYLMSGEGTITLNGKDYDVAKGNGIYVGPGESAGIRQRGSSALKLFHLVVPELK